MALSCGISGAIAAVTGAQQSGVFTSSIFTLPVIAANVGIPQMIGIAIACVAGFASTLLFGYDDSLIVDPEE